MSQMLVERMAGGADKGSSKKTIFFFLVQVNELFSFEWGYVTYIE